MVSARTRVRALVGALVLAGAAAGWAADQVVVEDWARAPVGTRGVPPGWQGQNWGRPRYDLAIVRDGEHAVLRLRSDNDSSTILQVYETVLKKTVKP